ncbi:MAG: hypothetical protein E7421_05530 [Ruminococcaceae bacterium]|nr:hypothetical protein [Oscillospiraceae bacterium]
MKILSMTATFGKLSQQTLTLEQGLNIIEAPNEWGKSTWCSFIIAMLYGIDTGSRTKAGFLADKEHYAPWSGAPMSGSMNILWNGREITIQRQNKGRTPLGEVKAFETQTGLPVPELSVPAPGQVLLGVERSVFTRAGFLRLAEMPVTEDESLRRRLNELVTTGDESGASDALAQKLRDLKNKCRFNKKGLLPEAEAELVDLEQKLQHFDALKRQISSIHQRQKELEEQSRLLENHKQALEYAENLQYAQKLAAAQVSCETAAKDLSEAEAACQGLPEEGTLREHMARAEQLRENRDTLHTKAQLLPPLPQMPVSEPAFQGKDGETAAQEAQLDSKVLTQLQNDLKKPIPLIISGFVFVLGLVYLCLAKNLPAQIGAGVLLLCGIVLAVIGVRKQSKLKKQIADLLAKYRGLPANQWETAAQAYAAAQQAYQNTLSARQTELEELNRKLEENNAALASLTGGQSVAQFEESCRKQLHSFTLLQEKRRALLQAEEVLQALSGAGKQVSPPQFADVCTESAQETSHRLAEIAAERQQLHQRLGQYQGQMHTLGQEEALLTQKERVKTRIAALEKYYCALVRAQEALQQATQELQRRFAPRISQRAQALFARLTGNRYQRLSLCQDLSLEAGAEGENILRSALWRSDGTVDQLYLALRLAVAEELTPDAPLVLDDALVRFDDTRLSAALQILEEEAAQKQVILFTCQSREQKIQEKRQ